MYFIGLGFKAEFNTSFSETKHELKSSTFEPADCGQFTFVHFTDNPQPNILTCSQVALFPCRSSKFCSLTCDLFLPFRHFRGLAQLA